MEDFSALWNPAIVESDYVLSMGKETVVGIVDAILLLDIDNFWLVLPNSTVSSHIWSTTDSILIKFVPTQGIFFSKGAKNAQSKEWTVYKINK